MKKILVIRFSSFGDIVQAMSVVPKLKTELTQCEIHWLTKDSFSDLVSLDPSVSKVWSIKKGQGLIDLIKLAIQLRKEKFHFIYDAHSNLRSLIVKIFMFAPFFFLSSSELLVRKKERFKRFLLFYLRINKFPTPFRGADSYIRPLSGSLIRSKDYMTSKWSFPAGAIEKVKEYLPKEDFISLVPSAAWEMKRWPIQYWKDLINLNKDQKFVILGGPEDHFCQEIQESSPENVINLAGKLSIVESCAVVSLSEKVVSADTGLIHVAEILGIKGVSMMGPTAFGFPTAKHIQLLETKMSCRPCSKDGRGNCSQDIYQKCMVEIKPEKVADAVNQLT